MVRIPFLALRVAVLLLFFLCAGAAEASQCLEDSRKKALESAEVAFFGRVVITERPDRDRENRVTLSVEKVYKGEPGPVVLVLVSGFKGGLPFERGKRYLVFADRDEEGRLWVYDCSGTVEETYAAEALALVNNPPATEPGMPVPASSAPAPSASSTPAPSARPSAEPASAASSAPPVDASPPPPPPTQAGGCGSCAMGSEPGGGLAALFGAGLVFAALTRDQGRRRFRKGLRFFQR
ncbi:MAG: hypothetical protein JNL21_07080 [Myxococcales bacterium]|nr:hypothetical protein [Myxococcales bacterium]